MESSSSVSADLGPAGATDALFGVAFTMVSFTPFCNLSFSLDAISGFYTSEGFLSPGLVLAGVIVDEVAEEDEIVDLFIGSCTDYLAAPNRLVVPGVGLVVAAVVGRFNPLFAVELI